MMNAVSVNNTDNRLNEKNQHAIHMEQRNKALITGVQDICCYHENEIILKLQDTQLVLSGKELHLGRLLLDEGRVDVEGHIDSILYEVPRSTIKQLFPWKHINR